MATFESSPEQDPAVAQAIHAAMEALRELQARLDDLETASAERSQPGADGGDRFGRLEEALDAIDTAASQTELLATLLEQAGQFGDRTLFLVLDGERLKGWAGYGFDAGHADVTEVDVAPADELALREPVESGETGSDICAQLGAAEPASNILVPFVLRGKTAGALYADRLPGGGDLDRPELRILTYVAAQALETLPLRAPRALDSVTEEVTEESAADAPSDAAETGVPYVDVSAVIQEVASEGDSTQDEGIVAIHQDVAPTSFVPAPGGPAEIASEDEIDTLDEPQTAATPDGPGQAFATQQISSTETPLPVEAPAAETTSPVRPMGVEVEPPSDLDGPGWAFGGPESISDDTRHEEARRLARLLVTEIKLYNEEKVREAREAGDLYDQLRDDIERSRRIYEERIDDEVRTDTDYFQEEVERILAGGDSTALGS
jgi:hypothetical protein